METIYVLTEEWYDIIYLENNNAIRNLNKDKGTFVKNNNILVITWNEWGDEFFSNFNNIYYKLDNKDFIKIYIESDDIIDYAILYPSRKIIQFVNYNLEGMFYFDKLILKIKFDNINHYETFYSMNYGRYFSSAERVKNNPNKVPKQAKLLVYLIL